MTPTCTNKVVCTQLTKKIASYLLSFNTGWSGLIVEIYINNHNHNAKQNTTKQNKENIEEITFHFL